MNILTRQLVIEARKHSGVREVGHNSGPEINAWLARVYRKPGAAWCAAFAWCCLDDAIRHFGVQNPVPPTAGVHLLMERARELGAWTREPGNGYIYAIDHGKGFGHCGVVVEVEVGHLMGIEGNTNEAGSREGNTVALKSRPLASITLGYLDPGMLFPGAMPEFHATKEDQPK